VRHYAFNVGDYAAATAHLSNAEDLVYRRLLDAYYARETPLPTDEAMCCRLIRATTPAARRAVGAVLREFFSCEPDGWHQKRVDIEIARYRDKSAKARASGQRSGEIRRTNVERTLERPLNERIADVELTTNHEPRTTTSLPTVGKKAKAAVAAAPLPDWLPADPWARFLEARIAMKARATPHGQALLIAELDKLRQQGHDPTAVLDQSIARSWRGLFPIKSPDAPRTAKHDRRDQVAGGIWPEANNERHDDRTIDGTAERVA
jgi:uncharacterized protein YdaU (DUF1376 family)